MRNTIEKFAKVIMVDKYFNQDLSSLRQSVQMYSSYIRHSDEYKIVAVNNGLSYFTTSRGVLLQITPNTIKIKDLDGQIKVLDTSELKNALKSLSHAISEEVKDWILSTQY